MTTLRQKPRVRANGEGSIFFDKTKKRWVASVVSDGRRVRFTADTRNAAKELLKQANRHKDADLPFADQRVTVGTWLDYWLDKVAKPGIEPTTYQAYEIMVRKHIKPYLGSVPLQKLTPEHVEHWLRRLEQAGCGVQTRRSAKVRLTTALQVALKRSHVQRNVAQLIDTPAIPKPHHAPPVVGDLQRLLKTIEGDRLHALVYLALGAGGLRRAEVLGLHWEDIDMETRVLSMHRRVNRLGKGVGLLIREGGKTDASSRTVQVPTLVIAALRKRFLHQLQERHRAGHYWQGADYTNGPSGWVFTNALGTVLEPRELNKYFADARGRAGLDEKKFHGLRHDFAGLALMNGIAGRVVTELMGHSNYSVTANLYQHVPDVLQVVAADRWDDLFRAADG